MAVSIALDTVVAIDVLNDSGAIGEWAKQFAEVYLPVHVVGELMFGAKNSGRPAENIERIEMLLASSRVVHTTNDTAVAYAEVRLKLKQAGTPIPENDMWIAALCIENNIPLATKDRHFERISNLSVIQPT